MEVNSTAFIPYLLRPRMIKVEGPTAGVCSSVMKLKDQGEASPSKTSIKIPKDARRVSSIMENMIISNHKFVDEL